MKKKALILKLLVSVLILGTLIYKVGIKSIIDTLLKINILYLPIIFIVIILINFFGAWKLMLFFKPVGIKMPFWKIYHYYFLTWCLSLFIPGKIGELWMVYFLKKEKTSLGIGSAVVIMNKLIGIIVVFFLAIGGMPLFFDAIQSLKIISVFFIGLLLSIYILFSNFSRKFIRKFILRKWESKFEGFSKTLFTLLKNHKPSILYNSLLSLINWITNAFVIYFLFLAFGQHVPILKIILINAILTIITMIPISINGLGIKEYTGVFLFSLLGISTLTTTSVFLTYLISIYLISLIYIILFFERKNKLNITKSTAKN